MSLSSVKELRQRTGAGVMDCKNALTECDGDIEKAIAHLRKTGMAAAAKKAGRIASEGVVHSYIHGGGRIQSAVADSFDDHRIAMSLAIAGLVSEGTIGIERAESVDISYPTFWRDLDTLSGVVA